MRPFDRLLPGLLWPFGGLSPAAVWRTITCGRLATTCRRLVDYYMRAFCDITSCGCVEGYHMTVLGYHPRASGGLLYESVWPLSAGIWWTMIRGCLAVTRGHLVDYHTRVFGCHPRASSGLSYEGVWLSPAGIWWTMIRGCLAVTRGHLMEYQMKAFGGLSPAAF